MKKPQLFAVIVKYSTYASLLPHETRPRDQAVKLKLQPFGKSGGV